MTDKDPLAGLKAATEHLTKDTPKEDAMAIIKGSMVLLFNLSPLELEEAIDYLKKRCKLPVSWWAALKKEVKKKRSQAKNNTKAQAEFGELEEVNRVHPAVDFPGGGQAMVVGFRVDLPENETGLLFIVSDDRGVRAEINPDLLEINNTTFQVGKGTPAWLKDQWSLNKAKTTVTNHIRPQALFQALKDALARFLDMQEPAYGLLAAWATGTYFAHAFTAYPVLHLYGPKETGKSKTLEALSCVSFNSWKGRDITAAALGDTCEGLRGTLLIDQAERLGQDQNGGGNLVGLLADSYKKAGGKRRVVEVSKAGRTVLEFSTYGPKAFASTKQLDPDLADRCIRIAMTRTRQRLPDLEGWEPVWAELRDKLYRFALGAFREVIQNYQEIKGDGTRIGELWRPLWAVLKALGVDQRDIELIRILFMAGAIEGQHELTQWESILFEVLREKAEFHDSFEMTAEEILGSMDIEGEHQPGVKWIGNSLSRFSLYSKRLARKYTDENEKSSRIYLNPGTSSKCMKFI